MQPRGSGYRAHGGRNPDGARAQPGARRNEEARGDAAQGVGLPLRGGRGPGQEVRQEGDGQARAEAEGAGAGRRNGAAAPSGDHEDPQEKRQEGQGADAAERGGQEEDDRHAGEE